MRRLKNFLRALTGKPLAVSNHLTWERHQRKNLRLAVERLLQNELVAVRPAPLVEPLFPGSMLMNQLCVSGTARVSGNEFLPVLDSLDVVYESLSVDSFEHSVNSIFIDFQSLAGDMETLLVEEIHRLLSERKSIDTLVVWNDGLSTEFLTSVPGRKIRLIKVHPQWHSPAYMLALYRSAGHCVFVDSHRAVDAIVTRIPCSLLVSEKFSGVLKTQTLFQTAGNSDGCRLIRQKIESSSNEHEYSIVENRLNELRAVLNSVSDSQIAGEEQLNKAAISDSGPVITRHALPWLELLSRQRDITVAWRKKWQKLVEDPRGFCLDSKYRILRLLATQLPDRLPVE